MRKDIADKPAVDAGEELGVIAAAYSGEESGEAWRQDNDTGDDDPVVAVYDAQEFALLVTTVARVD